MNEAPGRYAAPGLVLAQLASPALGDRLAEVLVEVVVGLGLHLERARPIRRGARLGILDHVVIGDDGHFISLAEQEGW